MASTATGASAGSGSSACRSLSGTACARTARSTTTHASPPTESRCRSIRRPTCPPGFDAESARRARRVRRRSRRHGHVGDVVADAVHRRAAGSATPDLWSRTFPMDLRPQAHDIIRTWLFSTVLRAHLEDGRAAVDERGDLRAGCSIPTARRCRSRRATSSTPMGLLDEHGSDAVRYWAAKGGPGVDTAFDPGQMKVGRRLAIKLLNASRFVLLKNEPAGAVTASRSIAACCSGSPSSSRPATRELESVRLRRGAARDRDVLLVVLRRLHRARQAAPQRMDGAGGRFGRRGVACAALDVVLRLFAPFLPFVTEEVWSWWRDRLGSSRALAGRRRAGAASRACGRDRSRRGVRRWRREITARDPPGAVDAEAGFRRSGSAAVHAAATRRPSVWALRSADVLAGNNVGAATVGLRRRPISRSAIEPQPCRMPEPLGSRALPRAGPARARRGRRRRAMSRRRRDRARRSAASASLIAKSPCVVAGLRRRGAKSSAQVDADRRGRCRWR